ncbi:intradiol ring-cleavage dioxygenase [Burkholderia cenocepacia]|uniref:intradiol ring-cleavage dioxygenase n=1 Tax=Burkholderia cenocepacia TaxID=95486 RepID=UPI001B94FB33|nr:intradiol ring-cleavage dioxygenase [Burkholderia cenocepacia]MBR8030142.1 intradiol ring-cleavage dioxygenase [Burkholderia cenocepacia]MBR8174020.1 intradiol ring-cleavage dioxygenase [Burkholderia cenocepacia]
MRNFNEDNITAAVLARLSRCRDDRTKQISEALVRHLHAFVKEIAPTEAEWAAAICFLTKTGHMCSDTRQEFILLSDTLGVSMLVDAINHRLPGGATETTVLGPFYVEEARDFKLGENIALSQDGQPMLVEGTVRDTGGKPIEGALIETWHADHHGFYDVQQSTGKSALDMRARLRTDSQGRFWYHSIVPSAYPIPNDGPVGKMLDAQGRHPFRPAHVHFKVSAQGFETIVTHVFLDDDEYLDSDVVFGVKDALIASLKSVTNGVSPAGHEVKGSPALLSFDFALPAKR